MLERYSNNHSVGTLYLTATHLIFMDINGKKQIWVMNGHIANIEKQPLTTAGSPLHIKCKHFLTMTFIISKERDCHDIYVTLTKLSSPSNYQHQYKMKKYLLNLLITIKYNFFFSLIHSEDRGFILF